MIDLLLLCPLFSQKEITNILMFNTISAHIKFIKRNDILREIVSDIIICTKFTFDCIF